jgi:hypothetical protein
MKGPGALVRADGAGDYSAARVRAGLTAAGWRITSFREETGAIRLIGEHPRSASTARVHYEATRGGLKLEGNGSVVTDRGLASYDIEVWPRETAAVRPLTVAGLLTGALAGWMVAAGYAYRLRGRGRVRRLVAALVSTAGFVALAVPVIQRYRAAYQVLVYAHGSPCPYIVDSPSDVLPTLPGTVIGLVALAGAAALAAAGPRPSRRLAAA